MCAKVVDAMGRGQGRNNEDKERMHGLTSNNSDFAWKVIIGLVLLY